MATTIVYPSLDVSGTGSISTIISTAGTFAGSLSASTFAVTGTATFSGTAVFLTTAQFLGTVTFSSSVRALGGFDVSGTISCGNLTVAGNLGFTNTVSFAGQVLMSRGTGFYTPNSYLLGTATGAQASNFLIAFSNTFGGFNKFEVYAAGKSSAATSFFISLFTDGGTTPVTTYVLAANTTATSSEAVCLVDIVQDLPGSGLIVAVPRFQHFKGVTTQATQTRTVTFTASIINAIAVGMVATATTKTMSAATVFVTGWTNAR